MSESVSASEKASYRWRTLGYAMLAAGGRSYAPDRFPAASLAVALARGSRKGGKETTLNLLRVFRKSGAGDGIRTHDPNLGKVVLYP